MELPKKKKELLKELPETRLDFKGDSIRRKTSEIDREIFKENRDMLYKRAAIAETLGKPKKSRKKKQ